MAITMVTRCVGKGVVWEEDRFALTGTVLFRGNATYFPDFFLASWNLISGVACMFRIFLDLIYSLNRRPLRAGFKFGSKK